ncbi:MAG: alpha/beta hydrolase, partial [Capsulimonadaceae bacterium]
MHRIIMLALILAAAVTSIAPVSAAPSTHSRPADTPADSTQPDSGGDTSTSAQPGDDGSTSSTGTDAVSSTPDTEDAEPRAKSDGTVASHTRKIPGRLLRLTIETSLVRPRVHRRPDREVLVYLPESYDQPAHAGEQYDVIYLLHGSPGFPSDFVKRGDWPAIEERVGLLIGRRAAIMVMPDGNYSGEKHGDSEWANSADGRDRFEDFVVDEVVPWADSHFRTNPTPAGRLIGGVSEGGFGAVNIALHHP